MDTVFRAAIIALAIYGLWAVRRNFRRGVASARGFQFDRVTQPKGYRRLMTVNVVAATLLVASVPWAIYGLISG